MKRLYILAAVMLSCVSCGTFSRYERPDIDVDYARYGEVPSWRNMFADPLLQGLIDSALVNSTSLQTSLLRVREAQASLEQAGLAFLPSVGASGSADLGDGGYGVSLSSSWQIDIFGKIRNARMKAKATLEERQAYSQAVQSSLVAMVATAYYSLMVLDSQEYISEKTLENWDKTITVLESLKLAGKTNDIAILQARAKKMNLESSAVAIRKNIEIARNNLCALAGISPREIPRDVLGEEFSLPEIKDVPLKALVSRPDVREAENALAAAFYATAEAKSAFYPDITLTGAGSWNGEDIAWSALGNLAAPIFNRGDSKAALEAARLKQEEARLGFRQALLDAGAEVDNAIAECKAAKERMEIDTRQRDALSQAVEKIELMMHYSTTNYLEVLTAQQSLLDAELGLVSDQQSLIGAGIALYQALGGGI